MFTQFTIVLNYLAASCFRIRSELSRSLNTTPTSNQYMRTNKIKFLRHLIRDFEVRRPANISRRLRNFRDFAKVVLKLNHFIFNLAFLNNTQFVSLVILLQRVLDNNVIIITKGLSSLKKVKERTKERTLLNIHCSSWFGLSPCVCTLLTRLFQSDLILFCT